MSAGKRREHLEVLELPHDATPLEIKTAYQHLKELYTKGSIAISPMEDEYPDDTRQEIINRIEEAYAWLTTDPARHAYEEAGDSPSTKVPDAVRKEIADMDDFDGATLKSVRERLGIDLGEVEFLTKISMQHIKNMEADKYKSLPEEVFVRGYVNSYAKCLGLDPVRVSEGFLSRYRAARQEPTV